MSLEGEVDGRGMRPVEETTDAEIAPQPRRSRLPGHAAGNTSEHAGSVRQAQAPVVRESATCRHHLP